jgi:hypothetical protein
MPLLRVLALSTVLGAALLACSGGATPADGNGGNDAASDGSSDGGGNDPAAVMTACQHVAMARCSRLDACTNNLGATRTYGSAAVCIERQVAVCVAGHQAPMTATTAANTEACATALAAQTCTDWRASVTPTACLPAHGPLAAGMPCVAAAQCQTGFCQVARNQQCGVCAAEPAVGAACGSNGLSCGRDLTCATNNTCAQQVAASGVCDDGHPCTPGLACVRPTMASTMGTCQPEATMLGAACSSRAVVAATCDGTLELFCNAMSQCAQSATASAGGACGVMGMAASDAVCTGGASCPAAAMAGGMRTCLAPAADGMPCDTNAGPDCLTPSRCVLTALTGTAGTCRAFDPNACSM